MGKVESPDDEFLKKAHMVKQSIEESIAVEALKLRGKGGGSTSHIIEYHTWIGSPLPPIGHSFLFSAENCIAGETSAITGYPPPHWRHFCSFYLSGRSSHEDLKCWTCVQGGCR